MLTPCLRHGYAIVTLVTPPQVHEDDETWQFDILLEEISQSLTAEEEIKENEDKA